MLKSFFNILFFLSVCLSIGFVLSNNVADSAHFTTNTVSDPTPESLIDKSTVDPNDLLNVSQRYSQDNLIVNKKKQKSNDQILKNDLIFDGVKIPEWYINSLKVELDSDDLANKFKNKNVDIYGISYLNRCQGKVENRTACVYGGLTLSDDNVSNNKSVEVKVLKNKFPGGDFQITIDKKNITVQELDIKSRRKLINSYGIYDRSRTDFKKAYIKFQDKNNTVIYDLYDFGKREFPFDIGERAFKKYKDNKIVDSDNLTIEVNLFS